MFNDYVKLKRRQIEDREKICFNGDYQEPTTPTGKITITENGTNIDVAQYAKADVNVSGGGGSSDFSTAEVTIEFEVQGAEPTFTSIAYETTIQYPYPLGSIPEDFSDYSEGGIVPYTPNTPINLLMYNSEAFLFGNIFNAFTDIPTTYFIDPEVPPVITGSATYDSDEMIFTITGDCTLKITMTM